MIELKNNQLAFTFPEIHARARLVIEFQRTLRIPDDARTYPLPPGLGAFPLRHVDDHAATVPAHWLEHGGVMLPMYQAEATWLRFVGTHLNDRRTAYPFAVKVATGKINAVSGQTWSAGLNRDPQDYVVIPRQPWLDGYCVSKGCIRQFVAMPLGAGYSAEEQLTGEAEHGGLQLVVYPMKREVFERRFPVRPTPPEVRREFSLKKRHRGASAEMGLAPGGRMRQSIHKDPFNLDDWDLTQSSRCFVHVVNSLVWRAITGQQPPTVPPTAKQYSKAGLPWFDHYDDGPALEGSPVLQGMKSVAELGQQKGDVPLPENDSCTPAVVLKLGKGAKKGQVREGTF